MDNTVYYYAIIGDIISSRKERERAEVQRKLNEMLKSINNRFKDGIAADFLITLGDEFQGLIYAGGNVNPLKIAVMITNSMYPVKLRISIGFGTMSTDINREYAIGADGEAFHNARAGMNNIRANEKGRKAVREICGSIAVTTLDKAFDEIINTMLMLSGTIRKLWTARQSDIARRYTDAFLNCEDITQISLAKEFGITQSTFNMSLTSSNAREYVHGIGTAISMLDSFKRTQYND